MKNKRKLAAIIIVIILLLLLVPRRSNIKDGGSIAYEAILYKVTKVHRMNPNLHSEKEFLNGMIIEIFGFEIYNNVR